MKKLIALALALLMIMSFVACAKKDDVDGKETEKETAANTEAVTTDAPETEAEREVDYSTEIKITVISGTTGMGFAKMMTDAKNGEAKFPYSFELVSDAEGAKSAILGGTADLAAVPTNLAAVLAAKTSGGVQIVAANTEGVLYLLQNGDDINNMSNLAGKTIYCCQQGANPEYITSYLLKNNGYEVGKDVFLDFTYNSPDELASALASGLVDNAVLPEPKVTATLAKNENLRVALNFTEEWKNVTNGAPLIQGCLIATKVFIDEHGPELDEFLKEYGESVNYNLNADNYSDAANLIADLGIIPSAGIALKALPNCNLCFMTGSDMITGIMSTLTALYEANPASVGGAEPNTDTLFYIGK